MSSKEFGMSHGIVLEVAECDNDLYSSHYCLNNVRCEQLFLNFENYTFNKIEEVYMLYYLVGKILTDLKALKYESKNWEEIV